MFLLNLGLAEFLTVFVALSGIVVSLYLLSRSRRKLRVSTLRFWNEAVQPVSTQQHRRIQQPWSLILQLLSLLLLLLALGQLRLGSRDTSSRDHVLVLDTSSWMAAKSTGKGTLLDEAKRKAKQYVRALPSTDRIMLIRADGLPSPSTRMETDHSAVEHAIDDSRPGGAALNLNQALSFARQVRMLNVGTPGEIVFVGAGRLTENGEPVQPTPNLRVLSVAGPNENCGITRIGLRRSPEDGELWEVFVSVRNYGASPRRVPVVLQFGGATIGSKLVTPASGASEDMSWRFRTKAAGYVEARLLLNDALAEDNRALLEIPAMQQVEVAVYSNDVNSLRPILDANPQVRASYLKPGEYAPGTKAQVIIFDRFAPPQQPSGVATIWIDPPAKGTPFTVRTRASEARIVSWQTTDELGAGLRSKDLRLADTAVFGLATGDVAVAQVAAGPVIVARPKLRMVALGFNPGSAETRFDVATPLLMASILRWFEPAVFRSWEIHGGSVGAVTVPLDASIQSSEVQVLADKRALPFTLQGNNLRFFAGSPGDVRVLAGDREQVYSLSLPEVGTEVWTPPTSARQGIPSSFSEVLSHDIWQVLAILGALGLFGEWLLFGRKRSMISRAAVASAPEPLRRAS